MTRIRSVLAGCAVGLLLLVQAACILEPDFALEVRTDRAEYVLQDGYSIDMTVTLVNQGDRVIYFRGVCGSGDLPSRWTERVDGSDRSSALGQEICGTSAPRPPTWLGPGTRFVDRRTLGTSTSGVRLDEVTGEFRLVYWVRPTPLEDEEWRPIYSNRFSVVGSPQE